MSFVAEFGSLPLPALLERSQRTTAAVVRELLGKPQLSLGDFAALLSPAAGESLEALSRRSQALTRQRFGRVVLE